MAETTDTATLFEEFREEVRGQLDDMRRQLRQLRQMITAAKYPAPKPRSRDEIETSMAALKELHEDILRRRGGKLLPPAADEIACAREERTARILGEAVE